MPELLRFDDQNQQRSSNFVIFTIASNLSLFFSASSSIDHCSFASDVHDHDSFVSQLTQPGILKVSEADRLPSFFDCYGLGIRMINGLEGLLLSSLDAKLAPKHLFCLCLEHEQKLNSSHKSAHAYNFYKDSNAPVMVKMVELVTILQQRIVFLLNECDDHPALQKIVDVIEMILPIPFYDSAELDPIFNLVSSWQKLEFESCPALLDDVQIQFEINARKLLVNKTLYEKTIASGFGSVHFLMDASERQQYKEAILAYAILLKAETGQILCLIAMEKPISLTPEHIRDEKVKVHQLVSYVFY